MHTGFFYAMSAAVALFMFSWQTTKSAAGIGLVFQQAQHSAKPQGFTYFFQLAFRRGSVGPFFLRKTAAFHIHLPAFCLSVFVAQERNFSFAGKGNRALFIQLRHIRTVIQHQPLPVRHGLQQHNRAVLFFIPADDQRIAVTLTHQPHHQQRLFLRSGSIGKYGCAGFPGQPYHCGGTVHFNMQFGAAVGHVIRHKKRHIPDDPVQQGLLHFVQRVIQRILYPAPVQTEAGQLLFTLQQIKAVRAVFAALQYSRHFTRLQFCQFLLQRFFPLLPVRSAGIETVAEKPQHLLHLPFRRCSGDILFQFTEDSFHFLGKNCRWKYHDQYHQERQSFFQKISFQRPFSFLVLFNLFKPSLPLYHNYI